MLPLFVELENPVRNVEGDADDGRQCHAARNLAGGMAAHPVGNHHQVIHFFSALRRVALRETRNHRLQRASEARHEEMVLVVRPHVPGVGQCRDVNLDER